MEDVLAAIFNDHARQGAGLALELLLQRGDMVLVDVNIASGPDELPGLQIADLGQHHGEEAVACNVERYAQAHVATALVELAAESSRGHKKLEEAVAGGQRHQI